MSNPKENTDTTEASTNKATAAGDGLVVKLKYPFTTPLGVKVEELAMRRPKVRDLKIAQRANNSVDQELMLITIVSEPKLLPEDLDEMDLADYQQVAAGLR